MVETFSEAFRGQQVVFTGILGLMTRKEAIDAVRAVGAEVQSSVSHKTTLLVLGHRQLTLFQPDRRSIKHEEALSRIKDGQSIRIVCEDEFNDLLGKSY